MLFGQQLLEANRSDQVASVLVQYTHERPRGPEVPKWGDGYEDYPVDGRTPPSQSPPPPVSKWGSVGSGLGQVRKRVVSDFHHRVLEVSHKARAIDLRCAPLGVVG